MREDPVSHPETAQAWLGAEESAALDEVVRSGRLAQGPRVAAFELAFATHQQVSHAVAVASGTAALHLALLLTGVGAGDDVVVPSLSFLAAANVVLHLGARPVFADVDEVTGTVTATTVAAALTPRTRAVIAVDHAGVPVDLPSVRAVCEARRLVVIEDAACAAGSRRHGRPVGADAEIAAWSFHQDELLTTGEGGMITTARADWAERARRLRDQALDDEPGFSYRMTDMQGAVGLVQLGRLEEIVRRRRSRAAIYRRALLDIEGLRVVTDPAYGRGNFHSFWVEVPRGHCTDPQALLVRLASDGIGARRGTVAAHRQPAYAHLGHPPLPVTERLADQTVVLPLSHRMTVSDQARVVEALVVEALGRGG